MEKITYGAPRLVDWVAQIKVGAASVRVHFTGGALTSYGVTPAEFTTSNPFVQKVIEGSSYFKEGRIIKLRCAEIEEPVKPAPKPTPKPKAQVAPAPQPKTEAPVEAEAEAGADEADGAEGEADMKKVEVTCLPDAQAYLQEKYGVASYKVRSCETAQRIAGEHGFVFTGGKFDSLESVKKGEAAEE